MMSKLSRDMVFEILIMVEKYLKYQKFIYICF